MKTITAYLPIEKKNTTLSIAINDFAREKGSTNYILSYEYTLQFVSSS